MDGASSPRSWWVLAHQLPPEPPGLRVRIWRRLQALGALPLKNAVYVLPDGEETLEDLDWLAREIEAAGAEATLMRASWVAGITDEECMARFRAAAAAEYDELREAMREPIEEARSPATRAARLEELRRSLPRWRGRLSAAARRDFFGADGREALAAAVDDLARLLEARERGKEGRMSQGSAAARREPGAEVDAARGKTWVTRAGVKIDRTASAWLVRRFLDPSARFRFVAGRDHPPGPGELRFDMVGGEYTHDGERCTFEVMIDRFALDRPGLRRLAEIVHDLDLKEDRYSHAETAGVAALFEGLLATTSDDIERIEKAAPVFDALLARFAAGE